MTTVTLKTDEHLLAIASEALARRNSSLEQVWEETLRRIAEGEERGRRFDETLARLDNVDLGGPYSRDEMNER
jgi:hypothetical protein